MKKILLNIGLSIFLSIVAGVSFLVYAHFIGIPKTQARNFYNAAVTELEKGDKNKALELIKKASEYWNESYISEFEREITD